MAQPARFTFDLDMGRGAGLRAAPAVPTLPETVVAQMVQDAREEGFAQGLVTGEQNATSMAAQTLASAAATLATQTTQMLAALDDARSRHEREAVELAASIGRKLALHLLARQPTAELEALIAECMQNLAGVPHLVIRCHPDIADQIRDLATAHMQTSGFSGRLVVMGDPDQRLGDGRLEWVDGGLVRDLATIGRDIDERITAYLAAAAGMTDTEESGH